VTTSNPGPFPAVAAFVERHGRLPRLGDAPPPWRYRGWLLPYVWPRSRRRWRGASGPAPSWTGPCDQPERRRLLSPPTPNQRWLFGRDSYRPPDEPIRTAEYDVAALPDDALAKAFVLRHHYAGSYPAARWRFGLFRRGALQGVAVFSHPCNDRVLTGVFPGRATDSVELGRFVLLDEVPGNGETWMLGRCFALLRREGLAGVVAFSDPCRRLNRQGVPVFGGHVGIVYQAFNGVYLGRGTPRTLTLLPDGSVLSDRAQQKVRSADQGVRYAVARLVACGAEPPSSFEPAFLAAWLGQWKARLCHAVRHCGNHKYAWALGRRVRLPPGRPYPKQLDPGPVPNTPPKESPDHARAEARPRARARHPGRPAEEAAQEAPRRAGRRACLLVALADAPQAGLPRLDEDPGPGRPHRAADPEARTGAVRRPPRP
jgi:hypothetical protein